MKFVIFESGKKQYKVSEGDIVEMEKIEAEPNQEVYFNNILLYVSEKTCKIGKPIVKDLSLKGIVLNQLKGKKVRVAKYKSKVRYRRVRGQRKQLTRIKIDRIIEGGNKKREEETKTIKKTVIKKT